MNMVRKNELMSKFMFWNGEKAIVNEFDKWLTK